MPYKDKEKQKAYKKRWNKEYYANHKEEELVRTRKRKKDMRAWFNAYKRTLKCIKCGENHPACLEFHHPGKKDFTIAEAIERRGYSKNRILAEIDNCKVLCVNCHRKVHYKHK